MKIYYNNRFRGHAPVGVGAIVVALNASQAAALLQVELEHMGLTQVVFVKDMIEVSSAQNTQAIILADGNY